VESQQSNGDEDRYSDHFASFSKALPHDDLGVVDPDAYATLSACASTGQPDDFEAIRLGGTVKLANPRPAWPSTSKGPTAIAWPCRRHRASTPPNKPANLVELYWMALARDVHFNDYATDQTIADACSDLSALTDFGGPKASGIVTPATIFRGLTPGDLAGPPVSQFLLRDFAYGSLIIRHQQRTVQAQLDYLTDFNNWLDSQNGTPTGHRPILRPDPALHTHLRDLAAYVRLDTPSEAFMNACLMLLGLGVPVNNGNPYKKWKKQGAFVTFGAPHILGLVNEVATRALKRFGFRSGTFIAACAPEEYAGRVHVHLAGDASYPVHDDVLASVASSG